MGGARKGMCMAKISGGEKQAAVEFCFSLPVVPVMFILSSSQDVSIGESKVSVKAKGGWTHMGQ